MTIKELIEKLETAGENLGFNTEVDGCGDEATSMGILFLIEVGRLPTGECIFNGKYDWDKWQETCRRLGASTSREKDGFVVFYRTSDECIDL